jgi:hypothetical protein
MKKFEIEETYLNFQWFPLNNAILYFFKHRLF